MKTGITFIGFLLFFTGLGLAAAAFGSIFMTLRLELTFSFFLFAILGVWSGLYILRKCATLPISDERIHISHKLAR